MTAAEFRAEKPKPKRNKYGARKTVLDGITFDSKAEANRWGTLKQWEKLGVIYDLRRQVWHELKAANGAVACRYRADFDYFDTSSGLPITEDVKGVLTRDFKVKARLFKEQYGREIRIVK
ncbi:DUF1064 domain-containing protein [Aminobacter anthyllidis]|uniref:DUF1064 domain-containing protein n=2 Tax=Aminobacter anthyllidis TaxID=1035067 RepID=A0A9X1A6T7_9HYPH|nr:DUF1064 domain-containing protein [Aminobacter anthyllidis]